MKEGQKGHPVGDEIEVDFDIDCNRFLEFLRHCQVFRFLFLRLFAFKKPNLCFVDFELFDHVINESMVFGKALPAF